MPHTLDIIALVATLLIKPLIICGLALVFVARPSNRSAAQNHWLLGIAAAFSFGVVISVPVLPTISVDVLPQSVSYLVQIPISDLLASGNSRRVLYALLFLYFLGVSWRISYVLFSIHAARQLANMAEEIPLGEMPTRLSQAKASLDDYFRFGASRVKLVISNAVFSPMVMGFKKPIIILPQQAKHWSVERVQRVMAHEYAHIERCDWWWKILIATTTAILWFIPLVWIIARRASWYAEIACDNRVANWKNCRAEYADDLLALASDVKHHAFVLSYSENTQLFERIKIVLDPCENRSTAAVTWRMWVLIAMGVLTSPLAIARLQPAQNDFYPDPIAVYPQPVAVPMVVVPQDSPLADSQRRIAWLNRQLLLQQQPQKVVEQTNPIKSLSRSDIQNLLPHQMPLLEESLVVRAPRPRQTIIDSEVLDLHGEVPVVIAPRVAVSGYLPQLVVTPDYPKRALTNEITGKVIVEFDVNQSGEVIAPRIISATPSGYFEREVIRAIKQFRFLPLQLNGEKVITKNVTETFIFTLEG